MSSVCPSFFLYSIIHEYQEIMNNIMNIEEKYFIFIHNYDVKILDEK